MQLFEEEIQSESHSSAIDLKDAMWRQLIFSQVIENFLLLLMRQNFK